ncbi:MAG: hypothetical protein O3A87_03080 [Verrucomicrobia bacterium]|nr:hypothetical protein [Verrucomicrobiota bacterium]MDA1005448.1 hypothetical protein [Verrucomicrobiota bacterium]
MNRETKKADWLPPWVLLATAILAFVAIADLPYGFYRLVRWVVFAVGLAAAFRMKDSPGWMWGMGFVALVFNPIVPLHFDKVVWRFLDAGAGAYFVVAFRKLK